MPLALVTGPRPQLGSAAATLARTGFNVVTWETTGSPPATTSPNRRSFAGISRKSNAGWGPEGPFDCYVQLPCQCLATPSAGPSGLPADELVWRIDTLAAVASRLGPAASVLLCVEDTDPVATSQDLGTENCGIRRNPCPDAGAAVAPDLLAAVALALLEDLGRAAARVAVLSVADLCRPAPAFSRIDPVIGATQWEMPTPPLVSAP